MELTEVKGLFVASPRPASQLAALSAARHHDARRNGKEGLHYTLVSAKHAAESRKEIDDVFALPQPPRWFHQFANSLPMLRERGQLFVQVEAMRQQLHNLAKFTCVRRRMQIHSGTLI